jgi:hypothetical protein
MLGFVMMRNTKLCWRLLLWLCALWGCRLSRGCLVLGCAWLSRPDVHPSRGLCFKKKERRSRNSSYNRVFFSFISPRRNKNTSPCRRSFDRSFGFRVVVCCKLYRLTVNIKRSRLKALLKTNQTSLTVQNAKPALFQMTMMAMSSSSTSLATNNHNHNHNDYECSDECSIGIGSLKEDHQDWKEHNAQSRSYVISPMSNSSRQELSPFDREAGSSLSKLDLLRARNQHARRHGSMKIAETRHSLNASSSSLPVRSSHKPSACSKQWDESTAETVTSRTGTENSSPPSPQKMERPIPVQVLLQNSKTSSVRNKTLESVPNASSFGFVEESRRLQEENELLRRHISLLNQLYVSPVQTDRVQYRDERQRRARIRINRLWVSLTVLVVAVAARFILNLNGIDGFAVNVLGGRFVAPILSRSNVQLGQKQVAADEWEEKVHLHISNFGSSDSATHTLYDHGYDAIIKPRLEDVNTEHTQVLQQRPTRRAAGSLKRFLINIKRDNLRSWLKGIKS